MIKRHCNTLLGRLPVWGLLLCILLSLCTCAGGGTSGTGTLRMSGRVINDNLEPQPGVTVVDIATGMSATSDELGIFLLEVETGSSLQFTFAGQQTTLALDAIPPEASAANVIFQVSVEPQLSAQIVEVNVTQTREPSPTPTTPSISPTQPGDGPAPMPTAAPTASNPTPQPNPTSVPTGQPTQPGMSSPTPQPFTPSPIPSAPAPTAASTPTNTATPTPSYPRGDLNCDGYVDFGDIDCMNALINHTNNIESACNAAGGCPYMTQADLDGNGVINNADLDIFLTLL